MPKILDDEAKRNGHSFTLEAEKRLAASRLLDSVDGREAVSPFISLIVVTLTEVDVAIGRSWRCDADGLAVAQAAILKIMRSFGTPVKTSELPNWASPTPDHELRSWLRDYANHFGHLSALGERTAARMIELHRLATGGAG